MARMWFYICLQFYLMRGFGATTSKCFSTHVRCSSLCVDRRDLRSMQCAIPRGAPTLQSSHKRKQPSTAMPLCGTTSSPFSFVAARVAPMGTAPTAPLGGHPTNEKDISVNSLRSMYWRLLPLLLGLHDLCYHAQCCARKKK